MPNDTRGLYSPLSPTTRSTLLKWLIVHILFNAVFIVITITTIVYLKDSYRELKDLQSKLHTIKSTLDSHKQNVSKLQ